MDSKDVSKILEETKSDFTEKEWRCNIPAKLLTHEGKRKDLSYACYAPLGRLTNHISVKDQPEFKNHYVIIGVKNPHGGPDKTRIAYLEWLLNWSKFAPIFETKDAHECVRQQLVMVNLEYDVFQWYLGISFLRALMEYNNPNKVPLSSFDKWMEYGFHPYYSAILQTSFSFNSIGFYQYEFTHTGSLSYLRYIHGVVNSLRFELQKAEILEDASSRSVINSICKKNTMYTNSVHHLTFDRDFRGKLKEYSSKTEKNPFAPNTKINSFLPNDENFSLIHERFSEIEKIASEHGKVSYTNEQ